MWLWVAECSRESCFTALLPVTGRRGKDQRNSDREMFPSGGSGALQPPLHCSRKLRAPDNDSHYKCREKTVEWRSGRDRADHMVTAAAVSGGTQLYWQPVTRPRHAVLRYSSAPCW